LQMLLIVNEPCRRAPMTISAGWYWRCTDIQRYE
jgi:hypothetical protein